MITTHRWFGLLLGTLLGMVAGTVAIAAPDRADEVPAVKRLTGVTLAPGTARGSATEPTVIADAEALARAFPDAKVQAKIKEQVDFAKQQLVLFRWAGSGQDKIEPREQKDGATVTIVFDYTPGLTRDLRQHQELFAVRKGLTHKVERKKSGQ